MTVGSLLARAALASLSLTVLLGPPSALADIPPPPGYVETCTAAKQRKPGETCVDCRDSYHADREACRRKWVDQGYTQRCKTPGASAWTEVWCTTTDAGATDTRPSSSDSESSCAVASVSPRSGGSLATLLIAATVALSLRRRRPRTAVAG